VIQKLRDLILYQDPFYYNAFPSCIALDDGTILVSCRRALDPRYLLTDGAPAELRSKVIHVEARSHQAILRLDAHLNQVGEVETVALNTQAADQDGSLLKLASGRILLSAFSWYPFPPTFAETVRSYRSAFHGTPETTGSHYLMWGAFTRFSDDNGRSWSAHNYLPAIPDSDDIIPGKRALLGGAVRGLAVENCGEILVPAYTSPRKNTRSAAYAFASADNGNTWTFRSVVAADRDNRVDMHEPAFYTTPSGKVICFIRTANLEDHLVTAESTDNGRTWSEWQKRAVVGHPYSPIRLPDNRVLLVYGYRHKPFGIRARLLNPECENIDSAPEFVLRDDGLGTDIGYPWGCALPDGRALVTYYFYGQDGVRHIAGTLVQIDS
jgi:hypothetical protein